MTSNKKFNFKVFTSLLLFTTFLVLVISGAVLYISPPGRVANWTNWNIMGFSKTQWTNFHLTFAMVFLLGGIFHLFYFNWKLFWSYIKSRASSSLRFKKELFAASILSVFLLAGTYAEIPPMSTIATVGDQLSESWEDNEQKAPVSHAELLTLKEYAETIKEPVEKVIEVLKDKGFAPTGPDEVLADLASRNKISPSQIDELFKSKDGNYDSGVQPEGAGYGKMKLAEVVESLGLSMENARKKLNDKGISKIQQDKTLKDIASENGVTPREVFDALNS